MDFWTLIALGIIAWAIALTIIGLASEKVAALWCTHITKKGN